MTESASEVLKRELVFVGGLHRSGTTLLSRWLADQPDVSGFSATGVEADEGQHLQSVYPPARQLGGPGRFAFHPQAHLTEASPLVSDHSRERLTLEWGRHWDLARRVLVEKSPPNLTRMRFLEAMFPRARFVMVVRHPIAVSYATMKWTQGTLDSLLTHWVKAHGLFLADAERVHKLIVVRYEDLVADPAGEGERALAFLGLPGGDGGPHVQEGLNEAYLRRFGTWRRNRRFKALVSRYRYESTLARFGYRMREPWTAAPRDERVARYLGNGMGRASIDRQSSGRAR